MQLLARSNIFAAAQAKSGSFEMEAGYWKGETRSDAFHEDGENMIIGCRLQTDWAFSEYRLDQAKVRPKWRATLRNACLWNLGGIAGAIRKHGSLSRAVVGPDASFNARRSPRFLTIATGWRNQSEPGPDATAGFPVQDHKKYLT